MKWIVKFAVSTWTQLSQRIGLRDFLSEQFIFDANSIVLQGKNEEVQAKKIKSEL
jgi:hypothetical protein